MNDDRADRPRVIRVIRTRVKQGLEEEFMKGIRESASPWVRDQPGIEYAVFGRRLDGHTHSYVNVSVWNDLTALVALTGEDLHRPLELDGASKLTEEVEVELYELVEDPQRSEAPPAK